MSLYRESADDVGDRASVEKINQGEEENDDELCPGKKGKRK